MTVPPLRPESGPPGPKTRGGQPTLWTQISGFWSDFTLRNQQIPDFFSRLRRVLAKFTLRKRQTPNFSARLRRALVKSTLRNQQIQLFFRAPSARMAKFTFKNGDLMRRRRENFRNSVLFFLWKTTVFKAK